MKEQSKENSINAGGPPRWWMVFILAMWFGLVCGLVEGVLLVLSQKFGWLTWKLMLFGVSVEIIWVSAAFNLLLFAILALPLTILAGCVPRLRVVSAAVFLFSFLTLLDWALLTGRLRHSGALILALGAAVAFHRWFRRDDFRMLNFWRQSLPWVFVLGLLACVGIEGGIRLREQIAFSRLPSAAPGAPNVLLIVVDTLRADHLSVYGYPRPTSPNLERLAREGALFERAFSASSWTLPSHASLLTGRYQFEHGALDSKYTGRHLTLSEFFRDHGYRTGAFSANRFWFARFRGFGRGFIHFSDVFYSAGDMAARTVFGQKFDSFVMPRLGFENHPGRRNADNVNRFTLDWLGGHPGKPFFVMLNYLDVHDPYMPPPPYNTRFLKSGNAPGQINNFRERAHPHLTPAQLQEEVDAYDGCIAYLDDQIAALLHGLEQRGLLENTLVIFTSDHGESFGEHDLLGHRNSLYREQIQVPLILRFPGKVPAGVRIATPVTNTALAATILDLLHAGDPRLFPVPSLVPLLGKRGTSDMPVPISEIAQMPYPTLENTPAHTGAIKAVLSSQWEYLVHEKLGEELYDWEKDPKQQQNLAASPEGRAITADLRQKLLEMLHRKDIFGPKELEN